MLPLWLMLIVVSVKGNADEILESSGIRGKRAEQSTSDRQPADVKTNCLSGWHSYGEKCFKGFGTNPSTRLTWEASVQACAKFKGVLASIHSKEERDFLISFVMMSLKNSVWIGLHDRKNESEYVWEDGSEFDYTIWNEMEPTGLKNENEDCVEMIFSSNLKINGKWNDLPCDYRKSYICQTYKDVSISGLNPKYCSDSPPGGYSLQSSCYHLVKQREDWTNAENYCQSHYGGHLATINDFSIQTFLSYTLRESGIPSALWIGIKSPMATKVLKWSSGWHVAFSNLESDVSLTELRNNSCVGWLDTGRWVIEPCEQKLPFICEISKTHAPVLLQSVDGAKCPDEPKGWIDLGGDYCYFFDNKPVSWHRANFHCNQRGGYLVSIHSREEVRAIEQFIKYQMSAYHIGFYRKHVNNFTWVDGSEVDFTFWSDGEPNAKNEECAELVTDIMKWNDIMCGVERGYICSVNKTLPKTTVSDSKCQDSGGLSSAAIIGVVFCNLLVIAVSVVLVYYCKPWRAEGAGARKLSQDIRQRPKRRKLQEIVIKDDSDAYEDVKLDASYNQK